MAGTQNSWNNQVNGSYNNIVLNAGTNDINIGTDTTTSTINIGTNTGDKSINIGFGAANKAIIVGVANGTTSVDIESGSGGATVNSVGGTVTLAGSTGISVNSAGGTISIGDQVASQPINIGTGAAARTITLGNVTTTTAVNVNTGTAGTTYTTTNGIFTLATGTGAITLSDDAANTTLKFGTGAAAKLVTIGSTTGASALTLNSGSAGIKTLGVASVAVANKNYVTINTVTGALGSDTGPASSISITGDTGGALTGNSFTFTASGIGLSFAGAGSTETLGGTLKLANGGTNASLTASNGGIFYSTATAGAILSGTATANQVLLSGSSTTPAWSTATYPATTTINQLLYSSANNTVGGVTAGNYGVLISSSSGVPSWLANGTTGQVLTATTAGTPSWASAAGGNISITGDSGGALSSNAFTFTGGTTGLTFAGASTTETLGGTLVIANGGTSATSMSTSTGIVKYDGTKLVTSTTAKIDSSNIMTNTSQPAFSYYEAASPTNVTGDGTVYTLVFDTKIFDNDNNFSTSTFTAPVTGRYLFSLSAAATNIGVSHTTLQLQIVTPGGSYTVFYGNPGVIKGGGNIVVVAGTAIATLNAADVVTCTLTVAGSTKTVGIDGGAYLQAFGGYLMC